MTSPWDTIQRTSPAYQGKPQAPIKIKLSLIIFDSAKFNCFANILTVRRTLCELYSIVFRVSSALVTIFKSHYFTLFSYNFYKRTS